MRRFLAHPRPVSLATWLGIGDLHHHRCIGRHRGQWQLFVGVAQITGPASLTQREQVQIIAMPTEVAGCQPCLSRCERCAPS